LKLNFSWIIITCDSGRAYKYALPFFGQPDKITTGMKLIKCGLNKDGKLLWGIDDNNMLAVWDIEALPPGKKLKGVKQDGFEKKDCWNLLWSSEDNQKFAFLEKNRLNIMKEYDTEEILTCNGYLAEFSNLEITVVMLEELMQKPWDDKVNIEEIVLKIETRVLRDLREMINNNINMNEIYQFIERNPHRKLWEIFVEHAMLSLDFNNAERAMLQYNDYLGLMFIKRVKMIDDDYLKRAEIYQFFLKYDKAEEVYNMVDRKDLIIEMRMKLGNWERVIQLIKESGYVQEDNLKLAYNNYANQLFEDKKYARAEEFYTMTNNYEGMVNVWFKMEKFEKAINFINVIPEGSEYLLFMADKFESVKVI
jgi:WD repeat-containing protein 35